MPELLQFVEEALDEVALAIEGKIAKAAVSPGEDEKESPG